MWMIAPWHHPSALCDSPEGEARLRWMPSSGIGPGMNDGSAPECCLWKQFMRSPFVSGERQAVLFARAPAELYCRSGMIG
jgi:hypothetical protein